MAKLLKTKQKSKNMIDTSSEDDDSSSDDDINILNNSKIVKVRNEISSESSDEDSSSSSESESENINQSILLPNISSSKNSKSRKSPEENIKYPFKKGKESSTENSDESDNTSKNETKSNDSDSDSENESSSSEDEIKTQIEKGKTKKETKEKIKTENQSEKKSKKSIVLPMAEKQETSKRKRKLTTENEEKNLSTSNKKQLVDNSSALPSKRKKNTKLNDVTHFYKDDSPLSKVEDVQYSEKMKPMTSSGKTLVCLSLPKGFDVYKLDGQTLHFPSHKVFDETKNADKFVMPCNYQFDIINVKPEDSPNILVKNKKTSGYTAAPPVNFLIDVRKKIPDKRAVERKPPAKKSKPSIPDDLKMRNTIDPEKKTFNVSFLSENVHTSTPIIDKKELSALKKKKKDLSENNVAIKKLKKKKKKKSKRVSSD